MLDIKRIRSNYNEVSELLQRKGSYSLEKVVAYDDERRSLMSKSEAIKARQNQASKEVSRMKAEGLDTEGILSEMKEISNEAKELQARINELAEAINSELLSIPNTPSPNVTIGKSELDNPVVREWGDPPEFSFDIAAHWDIGTSLGILDFETAVKISGARFSMWRGMGAKLERALISFMLDMHSDKYTEIIPPLMVTRKTLTSTGHLPKFEEDAFRIDSVDSFMIPTAEVPLTSIYADEIIPYESLPQLFCAFTPCFRAEAGSAGRDTRGLIRNHQFDKVELVKFSHPDDSYEQLESLTKDAQRVLETLGIAYRTVELCTGDMGFASAKTYDIEVWMPSYNRYVEISSCSNMEDYQARRANIRYRGKDGKLAYAHTLNGSALAVGRTFAALLENYQTEDGSVIVPEALRPYLGGIDIIRNGQEQA
ncbi:MAG: serine--tRNA ligase [Eubacteriaceae bacterium]|nr:serine--tRNA ligase [Eubacteriaceae bacterium]